MVFMVEYIIVGIKLNLTNRKLSE